MCLCPLAGCAGQSVLLPRILAACAHVPGPLWFCALHRKVPRTRHVVPCTVPMVARRLGLAGSLSGPQACAPGVGSSSWQNWVPGPGCRRELAVSWAVSSCRVKPQVGGGLAPAVRGRGRGALRSGPREARPALPRLRAGGQPLCAVLASSVSLSGKKDPFLVAFVAPSWELSSLPPQAGLRGFGPAGRTHCHREMPRTLSGSPSPPPRAAPAPRAPKPFVAPT